VGVLPGWNANGPDNLLDNAADVTFMLSTKHLLKAVLNQASGCLPSNSFVDVDQTYNFLKNNYPMSVAGTEDMNHKFYLIGLDISRFDDEPSITAMLQSLPMLFRRCSRAQVCFQELHLPYAASTSI